MKKYLLILFFSATISLYAKPILFNPGYNIHTSWLGRSTLTLHSVSLDVISLKAKDTKAISAYTQLNPYIGLGAIDSSNSQDLLVSDNAIVAGLMGIIGYGTDIVQGRTGLLVGGGLLLDSNLKVGGDASWYTSTGLGAGANFHITPGEGNFVLNAGLMLGWNPISFWLSGGKLGSKPYADQFIINLNLGIGWLQ